MSQESRQFVFTLSLQALRRQKAPAFNETQGGCAYRDQHGNRCAIGALLPDSLLNTLQGARMTVGFVGLPETIKQFLLALCPDIEFLTTLQEMHDNAAMPDLETSIGFQSDAETFPERLEQNARWLAEEYGLEVPEVEL